MNQVKKKNKKYGGNLIKIELPLIIILLIIGGLGYYYFFIYGNNSNNIGNNKQQNIPSEIPRKPIKPFTSSDYENRNEWSENTMKDFLTLKQ